MQPKSENNGSFTITYLYWACQILVNPHTKLDLEIKQMEDFCLPNLLKSTTQILINHFPDKVVCSVKSGITVFEYE